MSNRPVQLSDPSGLIDFDFTIMTGKGEPDGSAKVTDLKNKLRGRSEIRVEATKNGPFGFPVGSNADPDPKVADRHGMIKLQVGDFKNPGVYTIITEVQVNMPPPLFVPKAKGNLSTNQFKFTFFDNVAKPWFIQGNQVPPFAQAVEFNYQVLIKVDVTAKDIKAGTNFPLITYLPVMGASGKKAAIFQQAIISILSIEDPNGKIDVLQKSVFNPPLIGPGKPPKAPKGIDIVI